MCPPPSDNRPVCESGLQVWFSSEETGVCGVTLTLMLWLVGQRAFDDMLNERSEGAAQRGEGGDLPHQTATPVSPLCSPLSLHSLPLCAQKGCERRPAHRLRSESCFHTDSVTVKKERRNAVQVQFIMTQVLFWIISISNNNIVCLRSLNVVKTLKRSLTGRETRAQSYCYHTMKQYLMMIRYKNYEKVYFLSKTFSLVMRTFIIIKRKKASFCPERWCEQVSDFKLNRTS